MKAFAFFTGFLLVYVGVSPIEPAPLWISVPPIVGGLSLMFWSINPRKGNCYKRQK